MVCNENGGSPLVTVADHAGDILPRALGRLGVPETDVWRHIAWDIGIGAVSRLVAAARRHPDCADLLTLCVRWSLVVQLIVGNHARNLDTET